MDHATSPHLGPDDLDALLAGTPTARVITHLASCPECRVMAAGDRRVVATLARLPRFEPSPGFVDRVMARVERAVPMRERSIMRLPRRWSLQRLAAAAAVTLVVLGGMTGSVLWSLAHGDLLQAWGDQAWALLSGGLWPGLRSTAAGLAAQPWFAAVREALGSPVRVAVAGFGFLVLYAAGLAALRWLMAIPSRRMLHAA